MNYYQRHIGDYARDTRFLSTYQHGVYALFLDWYYSNESPIPLEIAYRIVQARSGPERRAVDEVLTSFFDLSKTPGFAHNKRADLDVAKYKVKSEANSLIAKSGWDAKRMRNASQTQCESNASHKPITNNHKKQEQKPLVRQAARYDEAFEISWAEYPKRGGGNSKAEAAKAWDARVRSGESVSDMAAGVTRYANFIRATGKEGTEFVKQAASFFGPNRHYLDDWIPPRIQTPTAAPSKTLSAIQKLEEMKNGLADTRNHDGLPKTPLLGFGPNTGNGFD